MSHQMTRTSLEQSSSSLPLPASRDSASACSVYLPHTIVCVFFVVSLALTGCQSEAGSSPDLFDGEPWTLSGPELKIGSQGRAPMALSIPSTHGRPRSGGGPLMEFPPAR